MIVRVEDRSRTAMKDTLSVLALAYVAVAVHNLTILAWGGLESVPFATFGLCQLTPTLVVLAYRWSYYRRLKELLCRPVPVRILLGSYLVTLFTLGICILLPYGVGALQNEYGEIVPRSYPLKPFLPEALLVPERFWVYVLIGAPFLHLLNAAGEEILWRGYLLDEMVKAFPLRTVYWLNGVFWGLWHAPMIMLLDWDFPGHPVIGILAITVSQICWSTVMVHLRLKTDSLWPAIIMHAVANAITIGLWDRMIHPGYSLLYSPWGVTGGALMAMAAVCVCRMMKLR